jgi:hypothetical protein
MHNRKFTSILCSIFLLVLPLYAQVRGRVAEFSGSALGGVTIRSEADYLMSTPVGNFTVSGRSKVIRFSKDGYRPVTKFLAELAQGSEVKLIRDANGLWKPPLCPSLGKDPVMSGWNMRFVLPKGLQTRKGSDIDYSTNLVCREKQCLQHGWGPLWSSGMPAFPEEFLAGLNGMKERDVYNFQAPEFPGVEYRGIRTNGTYVRHVGFLGETISYDHANKETAEMFDVLIDTFCWIERKP